MITTEDIQNTFVYFPETGKILRKRNLSLKCGTTNKSGYVKIQLKGKLLYAHRIAWVCFYNENPSKWIDHIDSNPSNNNTSGYNDVCFNKKSGNWRATIYINKTKKHLGLFDTKELAAKAYSDAAIDLYGEFVKKENLYAMV